MTKLQESNQWRDDIHVFKCWCGENSYLEVIADKEDGELYITITQHPSTWSERLKNAFKALKGLEFSASNSVMLVPEDIEKFIEALKSYKDKNKKNA